MGRGLGGGQPGRAEAGAQACPWGQAKARFQDRGARPGPISHGLGVWGRGSEGQPQTGRSVSGGKGRLRSITRKGWARAWNMGVLLSRGGRETRREGPGEAQGTESARRGGRAGKRTVRVVSRPSSEGRPATDLAEPQS